MSIFSFFSRKASPKASLAPDSSGLEPGDATQPLGSDDKLQATPGKSERHGQRELLYSVVRDTMTRVGILAASYKFKVLSLDTRGRQYLIMMDLVNGWADEHEHLTEIEAMLAQTAKVRHDILVTAVYWRASQPVTAGLSGSRHQHPAPTTDDKPAPGQPRKVAAPPGYEPLQQDEIAAFKRAIASASAPIAKPAAGQVVTSGRRNPRPPVEFADTQISPTAERSSPLSVTQYGDLN